MRSRQLPSFFVIALSIVLPLRGDCPFGLLSPSHYNAGSGPSSVATGDFNKDGYVDIAALNTGSGDHSTVQIMLGTAGGGFGAPTPITIDWAQGDILASDFNNDGKLDLIIAIPWSNSFTVTPHLQVLLGNGDGTFTPVPYTDQQAVLQNPYRMALGDFNHDGLIDVATTKDPYLSCCQGQLSIMQNVGGKMATRAEYTASPAGGGQVVTGITVGDFDGDGERDIAVSQFDVGSGGANTAEKIYLYYGTGDGTFVKSPNTIDVMGDVHFQPQDVKAGDFNGDGKDDLAIVMGDPYGGAQHPPLKISLSNGAARTFTTPVDYGSLDRGWRSVVKDIDGDGKLDIITSGSAGMLLFRGNGDGSFASQQVIGSTATWLFVDDFDRDGGPDIIATIGSTNQVDVYLNTCARITLNLTSSANPAAQGTPITVTGTVVSPPAAVPTGTITLKRGTTVLKSANLNAGTSIAATMDDLTPATYTFTAQYSGDSRFVSAIKTIQQIITVPPFGPPPHVNAISFGGPVQISWYATANTDHYEIERNNGAGWIAAGTSASAAFTDLAAPASSALLYRVRAKAADGTASEYSASDLALTYAFTDGTLQAGVTAVKRVHVTELRTAANAVRALAGLGAMNWAEPTPDVVRVAHISELRTAIDQARGALLLPTLTHIDPTLTPGTSTIRAVHFEELRAAMR
jgi:hypothetical protein